MIGGHDPQVLALPLYGPEHRALAEEVTAWARPRTVGAAPADVDQAARWWVAGLADGGFLAGIGQGGPDLRAVCVAREALAYEDDLADFAYSIQVLGATAIQCVGTAEQRGRWLPRMAAGTALGAFAMSEPGAGSDVAGLALRAEPVSGGYLLHGEKAWIAHAPVADVLTVLARTGEGPGILGLTAFLVPTDTPGVEVTAATELLAPRSLAGVTFDAARIPADAVLGRPGGGFPVALRVLDRARATVGAAAVGFARRALDEALVRARGRPIHGGRLWDLPTLRATLADLDVALAGSALSVARAAWVADHGGQDAARHAAAAKLHATETAQRVVDAAVQVFGAAGVVAGSVPERLYRQIRALRIYEGPSEVQRVVIADALTGRRAR